MNWLNFYLNKTKFNRIKLLILDVDGVLTDGSLYYGENGLFLKRFNSKDGLGIRILQKIGVNIAIISGGKSIGAESRFKDLDIQNYAFQITDKEEYVAKLQKQLKIKNEEIAFIGDDLNDLVVKKRVGIFLCPKDAHFLVKKMSDITLNKKGGRGCVREAADTIFKAKFNKFINQELLEEIKKTLVA